MTDTAVVAVDVGGTTMKGALVDPDGRALVTRTVPTPATRGGSPSGGPAPAVATAPDGGPAVTAALLHLVRDLATAAGPVRVVAAGVVTPGRVDRAAGTVQHATNLGWVNLPLRDLVSAELGVPVAVDHDARAAGLAETLLGAAAGGPTADGTDCLFVALGTGIGAALISHGQVRAGATWAAGELGHAPVYPSGERCHCGQIGCLEVYASAAAIGRRYAQARGLPSATSQDVVAGLGTDAAADEIWAQAVDALATALATSTMLLDPGIVVLGGGLARAGAVLIDPVVVRLTSLLAWRTPPPVVAASLGIEAGWRGAGLLAWAELAR